MSTPSFNIGLPLPTQQPGVYTAPVATPVPGYPTVPGVNVGLPTDTYKGVSGTNGAVALGAGGVAGYKAPRGIESVRYKLGITKYGTRSAVGRNYSRSNSYNRYGSYRDNGARNGYRSYSSNSRGNGRVGYRGQAAPFGLWAAVKSSVLVGGLISLAVNGYQYFNKQETGAQAGSNVAGDLVTSVAGGAGGAVASYVGCGMLAAMGMSGGLLTLAGLGLGIGGYFLADTLVRNTNLFKGFQSGVYKLFGGQ